MTSTETSSIQRADVGANVTGLVAQLLRVHGQSALDDDELARRLEGSRSDATLVDRLEDAVRGAGLRSTRLRRTGAELLNDAPRLGPALVLRGGDAWLLAGTRGPPWSRRLHLVDGAGRAHWLTADAITANEDTVEVLVVEAGGDGGLSHGDAHHHASPWQRIIELVRWERRDVGVVVVYGMVVAILSLATPLAVSALVGTIAFSTLLQPLVVLAAVLAVALLASGALRTLQLAVVELLQRRIFVRLVTDLAWRLPRVASHERDSADTSKLVNRFFDVVTAQKTAATLLLDGTTLVLEFVIGLTVLAVYSPILLVFSLVLWAAAAVVVFGLGRGGVSSSIDESYAKHDVAGWLEELVRNPTLFRNADARRLGLARAEASTVTYLQARRRHFRVLLRQAIGAYALQACASVALLAVGGTLVIGGTLSLGQLVAAEIIVAAVTHGLVKLHKQLEAAYDLAAAVDKIGHLVDLDTEVDDGVGVVDDDALAIDAVDVVIDDLNLPDFAVEPGESVALLDPEARAGAAIADALYGLRAPTAGRMRLGGDDLGQLALSSVRSRVQLARHVELVEGTLGENLRAGRRSVRARDLTAALTLVELDGHFLAAGCAGLDTKIIPGSRLLTTSVARRLMIARALLGRPGAIVIDGAADGLEPSLARRIFERLAALDATIVVVTADPAVAAMVPRVIDLRPSTEATGATLATSTTTTAPTATAEPATDLTSTTKRGPR